MTDNWKWFVFYYILWNLKLPSLIIKNVWVVKKHFTKDYYGVPVPLTAAVMCSHFNFSTPIARSVAGLTQTEHTCILAVKREQPETIPTHYVPYSALFISTRPMIGSSFILHQQLEQLQANVLIFFVKVPPLKIANKNWVFAETCLLQPCSSYFLPVDVLSLPGWRIQYDVRMEFLRGCTT